MPIKLNGATSGSVELDVPAAVGSDLQLTLPATAGTALVAPGSTSITVPSVNGTLDRLERAGNILQVKETYLDTAFSVSYTAYTDTDVTGLSVSLTPAATTSKVLIFVRLNQELNHIASQQTILNLKRGSTFVGRAAAAGSRPTGLQGTSMGYYSSGDANSTMENNYFHFLDSPGTASSITYQVSMFTESGSIMYVNRTVGDYDNQSYERLTSSILAMEIAG